MTNPQSVPDPYNQPPMPYGQSDDGRDGRDDGGDGGELEDDGDEYVPVQGRRTAGVAVIVAVVIALSGGLVGWLWTLIAPRLPVVAVDGGLDAQGKARLAFAYVQSEPEQPIAADGWFTILGLAAGVIFAVLVWWLLKRYRGPALVTALALGSFVAALVAWWVGYKIGFAQFADIRAAAKVGEQVNAPVAISITNLDPTEPWKHLPTGVVAIQPLAAAFTYTVLAGFSGYDNLRGYRRREPVDPALGGPAAQVGTEGPLGPGQFGPGLPGSSESAMGTART